MALSRVYTFQLYLLARKTQPRSLCHEGRLPTASDPLVPWWECVLGNWHALADVDNPERS